VTFLNDSIEESESGLLTEMSIRPIATLMANDRVQIVLLPLS